MSPAPTSFWPARGEVVDAAFTVGLVTLGILGYRAAYGGSAYLLLGGLGVVLGVVLAHVCARARVPVVLIAVLAAVLALLLGGLVLRDTAVATVLPSLATARGLGSVVVSGWKQLLTTVRPVGSAEHLLALPYLLGIVAGVTGHSLSLRTRPAGLPLLAPAGVVALSILFGGARPAAAFLQGVVFTALALAWAALRSGRDRVSLVSSRQRFFRPVAALGVLAVAAGAAWIGGPYLPGTSRHQRVVFTVQPPFDPGVYTSPLAAFRRYTKNSSTSVLDRTLFTATGLGADRVVRIATLDAYDGVVWGASNAAAASSPIAGFARVGTELPASGTGASQHVRLTVGEGWAGDVWLPTVGVPQSVHLSGPRAADLQRSLRYNLATATGVVPAGLQSGDVVEVRTRSASRLSERELADAIPAAAPSLPSSAYEPLRELAGKLSADAPASSMARLLAIGKKLQGGAYSDGLDAVPSDPGHGAGRLETFVAGKQVVGDDEQYAAATALMANALGVPARVVLFGTAEADGVVKGRDVSAGVEVDLNGHGWVAVPTALFTPPRDKKPVVLPQQETPEVPPKVVPPALRPLITSGTSTTEADTSPGRSTTARRGFALPGPLVAVARWGGPPVLLVLAVVGGVIGLKARRRSRRRQRGRASTRVVNGWAEVVDLLHDLGVSVTAGTRREQARALHPLPVQGLAARADATVFGPGEPLVKDVEGFWSEVDRTRSALLADLSRRRRLRAALSLRSLLPRRAVVAR